MICDYIGLLSGRGNRDFAFRVLVDYLFENYNPRVNKDYINSAECISAYVGVDHYDFLRSVPSTASRVTNHNMATRLLKYAGFTAKSVKAFLSAVIDDYEFACRFRAVIVNLHRRVPLVDCVSGHPIGWAEAKYYRDLLEDTGWLLMQDVGHANNLLNWRAAVSRIKYMIGVVYAYFAATDKGSIKSALPKSILFLTRAYQCTYSELMEWPMTRVIRTGVRADVSVAPCLSTVPPENSHYFLTCMHAMHSGVRHLKSQMTKEGSRISTQIGGSPAQKIVMEMPLSALSMGDTLTVMHAVSDYGQVDTLLDDIEDSMPEYTQLANLLAGIYSMPFSKWLVSAGKPLLSSYLPSVTFERNDDIWEALAASNAFTAASRQLVQSYLGMDSEELAVALDDLAFAVGGSA